MIKATCLLLGITVCVVPHAHSSELNNTETEAHLLTTSLIVQGINTISGHVFDNTRRPVPEIYVELLNDLYSTIGRVRTDGSGRYIFRGVPQGEYKIKVLPGPTSFLEQVQDVSIVNFSRSTGGVRTVSAADNVQLDFYLKVNERAALFPAEAIFVQDVPESAKKVYDQAVDELNNKKEEVGLANLRKAIGIYPDYYQAINRLGSEYVRRGHNEAAAILLTRAVEINPRGHMSLYALGLAQYNLKMTKAAIDSLRRSISLNSNSVNSHLWLGIALRQNGDLREAEISLKRAKDLGKNNMPDAIWHLALVYNQQKRYREAADELELFLKVQPKTRDVEMIKKLIIQLRSKTS